MSQEPASVTVWLRPDEAEMTTEEERAFEVPVDRLLGERASHLQAIFDLFEKHVPLLRDTPRTMPEESTTRDLVRLARAATRAGSNACPGDRRDDHPEKIEPVESRSVASVDPAIVGDRRSPRAARVALLPPLLNVEPVRI